MATKEQIIILKNSTTSALTRIDENLDHGEWWDDDKPSKHVGSATWTNAPPSKIGPGATVAWGSQSAGLMTGTEGWVKYSFDANGEELKIFWQVPFVGFAYALGSVKGFIDGSITFDCVHTFHGVCTDPAFFDSLNPLGSIGCPIDEFELAMLGSSSDGLTATTRVYDAVWRPATTGEVQLYGMKYDDYQKEYDNLWKDNWRIYLLNTYIDAGKRFYDAVWRPGTTAEIQFYGMSTDEWVKADNDLFDQSWRLYLFNTYVEKGTARYDAIWRPGDVGEIGLYGLTFDDYQTEYDKLWKDNWRIHFLNTYFLGGHQWYDAIWRPGTAGEVQLYGLTFADYQKQYDALWKEDSRLYLLNTYFTGGHQLYDAVWRPAANDEIQLYGLPFADYQDQYDTLWKDNWRLAILNTYKAG
jgi:Bacterial tandem repeat domain 1